MNYYLCYNTDTPFRKFRANNLKELTVIICQHNINRIICKNTNLDKRG